MTGARLRGLRRSGIREIMDLASAGGDVIHLEVGEPDFPSPSHVVEAASEGARSGFTKYTPSRGLVELRAAISDKLLRVNGITADPATDIVVTAGAANGLLVSLAAVVDPGDAVLLPDPGWPNYLGMVSMLGLEPVRYPLRRSADFMPDPDEIAALLSSTGAKAVVTNSPHNPTGAMLSQDVTARITEVTAAAGAVLVSDECYDQIVLDPALRHHCPAALAPDAPVVTVHSFSKTYAMTGWRIGYVSARAEVMEGIARIQETWLSCCSAPVQKAAEAALLGDQGVVEEMVAAYRSRRSLALDASARLGLEVHAPSGAFYLMVDVGEVEVDSLAFARALVVDHGVAVAPGDTFGPEARGMVRVSLAADGADIGEGLRRLAGAVGR